MRLYNENDKLIGEKIGGNYTGRHRASCHFSYITEITHEFLFVSGALIKGTKPSYNRNPFFIFLVYNSLMRRDERRGLYRPT